ncbi:hypothetical protein FACS1894219_01790 [Clostridia bacterium]|nr:hypothetical protein FACS1894219_01790 [Clostridia bacterium]
MFTALRVPDGVAAIGDSVAIQLSVGDAANPADIITGVRLIVVYNDTQPHTYNMTQSAPWMYTHTLTVSRGLYFYYFEAQYADRLRFIYRDGESDFSDGFRKPFQITVTDRDISTPDFLKGGIMYHIFVDRFARSERFTPEVRDHFIMHESTADMPHYLPDPDGIDRNRDVFGGNLAGIIDKLPYLKELNVSVLYLSPIFEAHSNHKYNTADYLKIDPMFGDDAIFDELIEKAQSLGIRIILDGVFNHTGDDSVYFNKYSRYDSVGAYQSEESKYANWYNFNVFPDEYDCWWGVKSLPCIRKDEPIFRAFICGVGGVIDKWMKRGIAGLRIDVADELSDRMLKGINKAVKEADPQGTIIGEVWEDASNKIAYGQRRQYLLGGQLDSVMNYPVKDAIIKFLREGDSKTISSVMSDICNNYPKESINCLMNIIGTHDTARILTALGAAIIPEGRPAQSGFMLSPEEKARGLRLLRAAAALQFTLPGFPCVFYGDEVGSEGCGDPFNRRFFPWDDIDINLRDYYVMLSKIRADNRDVYAEGSYSESPCKAAGVYQFTRKANGKIIATCVNTSEEAFALGEEYTSLLTGDKINAVPPGGAEIYSLGFTRS